jgi:hypothetical protein
MVLGVLAQANGHRIRVDRGEWTSSNPAILSVAPLDPTGLECLLTPYASGAAVVRFQGQGMLGDGTFVDVAGEAQVVIFGTSKRGTLAVDLLVNVTPQRRSGHGG